MTFDQVEQIYDGRVSRIFRARTSDGQTVVVKGLSSADAKMGDIARLEHAFGLIREHAWLHVMPCLGLGEYDGLPALVMPDLGARPLAALLADKHGDPRWAVDVARKLVAALAELHQAGIVHRDVNPSNVVLAPKGDLFLIDLDMAVREGHAVREDLVGTLRYISPEQTGRMNRSVDCRSDLYAAGATFFELLAGRPPFDSTNTLDLVHAHLATKAPSVQDFAPQVPDGVARVVERLLEKEPDQRYQSATGLLVDLDHCAGELDRVGTVAEFPLGRHDLAPTLRMSQRLHGRKRELRTLHQALEQHKRAVIIEGPAGVGKSALIEDFRLRLADKTRFYSGAFSQDSRSPAGAFKSLLRAFAIDVAGSTPASLESWRGRLADVLGQRASVAVAAVPELSLVLGPQPPPPPVPPVLAATRLQLTLSQLIHHLGTADSPAVLFIDDLQWADETSLELLQHLLEDRDPGRLLLLLAARPDSSACSRLLKRLRRRLGETIAMFALGPLDQAAVRDLLARTLHTDSTNLDALAGAVHSATSGNPFFIERYLRSAVAAGAVRPDPALARWDWDPQQMAHLAPTDNVLDLLALQVAKLPETTRQVLGTAACVGRHFSLDVVGRVEDMSQVELLEYLDPAIDAGMVQPADAWQDPDITHHGRFVHERIRDAFERSLGPLAPSRFAAVATLLAASGAAPADLASKLWAGRTALTPAQLIDAAHVQLQAGNEALHGGAARVACTRFDQGITLLGESNAPPRQDLEEGFVIAAMPAGRADETPIHLQRLRALAQDIDQRSRVECLAVKAAALCGDFPLAISIGLSEAARLGMAVPGDPAGWRSAILQEETRLQRLQAARKPQDLVDLPLISDPAARREIALLSRLGLVAFSRPEVFAWVHTRMAATSIEAGNNPETAQGWATYSLLCCAKGNYAAGRAYGSMARALADRFGIPAIIASVTHLSSCFAEAWFRPLLEIREEISRARQIAIDTGLAEIAVFTTWNLSWFDLLGGARIDLALSHVDEDLQLARNSLRHAGTETVAIAGRRRLLELRGDTTALCALDDAGHTHDNLARRLSGHMTLMTADRVLEMWVATHRADWALVQELATEIAPHLRTIAASQFRPVAIFAQAMAAIGSSRPDALQVLDRAIDQFDTWAAINSQRAWQLLLLRAERALLQGQASLETFDQAIDAAVALGRADGEALCCARAAAAWVDNRRLATSYATQAYAAYRRWGTPALASAIEARFPLLSLHIKQTATATTAASTSVDFNVDAQALIAATQAVSKCLDFDGLIQEVMRVTLRAGGGNRGGLFMLRQDQLGCVCVQIDNKFRMWDPDTPSPFPRSLVRLVARTGKPLLVGNARLDPRLQGTQWPGDVPQSVLCLPISSQARLLAVLVLENTLVAGAFTERHLSVLEIVAGQVAISLQNATLFQEQHRMVDAVSRFVPSEFLRLLGRPSIQDVVAGDAVEFDMGCLFSDIRNFTTRSEQMTAGEVFEFLNRYLSQVAPVIRSHGGFIDKYVGDGVIALFPVDPSAAVAGGLGLLSALRRFNARWGVPPVTIGIGIHWGHMLLGTLGSEQRLQGTVVSDAVNTASRLETLTKSYGVDLLISGQLWDLVSDRGFSSRALGTTVLRGRSTPTRLYEVLGDDPQSQRRLADKARFESAVGMAQAGDLAGARTSFQAILDGNPADRAAGKALDRLPRKTPRTGSELP